MGEGLYAGRVQLSFVCLGFCIVCGRLSRRYPGEVDGVACFHQLNPDPFIGHAQRDDLPQESHAPALTPFTHVREETTADENAACN